MIQRNGTKNFAVCKVLLRNCKVGAVAFCNQPWYNLCIKSGGVIMKLANKLIELRKENGWSQEEFAEKLDVSRQAVSRWENETALPDAQNILRISKLFNVTTDYLLNEDDEGRTNAPADETAEPKIEKTAPLAQKKKHPYGYLILAIGLVIVAACAIIKISKPANEEHHHTAFNSIKENEISPTCTSDGSYDEVIYCVDCNKEIMRKTQSVAKLSHTLLNCVKENEVAPTCIAGGSYDEVVYCTTCNLAIVRTHRKTEQIDHKYVDGQCILCEQPKPSEGLLYISNGDGTCFVAQGDCTDKNIVIPDHSPSGDKVVQIKAYAFWGNQQVKSIRIPETVTAIGEGAFEDCGELESVNLPSNITMIHSYTFNGCKNLKEITIPAGVYYIGEEAFADCFSVESIVIPASVTKIKKFAFKNFSGCDGTVTFEIATGWKVYDDYENEYAIVDFANSVVTPGRYLTFLYTDLTWKRS